jgi:hypothetical protein
MTPKDKTYLEWRCRTSWHPKYLKYIDEWISNITPDQLKYFRKEMLHLIENGTWNYDISWK